MTTKKPKKQKAAYPFPVELIDQLLAQVQNKDAESILGESGLAGQLKKMLAERMLAAELSHHLAGEDDASKKPPHRQQPPYYSPPAGLPAAAAGPPMCLSRNFSTRPQKSIRFLGRDQPCPSSLYSIHSTCRLVRVTVEWNFLPW